MSLSNTALHYGTVAKSFHWLTALLILTAIPLGVIAHDLPYDTAEQLAFKAQLFSLHKTVGISAFAVALLRILWALGQRKPAPLHPERRAETLLAEIVHWSLYTALVVVPLSGWVHHAATSGFAPILWPFGQSLPLVPKSEPLAALFAAIHQVFTKILIVSILLHIAGAIKHAVIDRDATLARMLPGIPAVSPAPPIRGHGRAIAVAATIYAVGFTVAFAIAPAARPVGPGAPVVAGSGNWQVEQGTLAITVRQFGSEVTGRFARWNADITFDDTPGDGPKGTVSVDVAIPSLTLGSVTDQAMGPDYFDSDRFPSAVFTAAIVSVGDAYRADGTLTLKGVDKPLSLPFTLAIDGDTARMIGQTTLDRRDFAIGAGQTDAATLGFDVSVEVDLTARRADRP